ncbi:hypothetical protein J3R82DRAFT_6200 [Butyriboletus roseoflavus]|nr:hypothetical protein J3R82DRAFT_6200 [Butyriboletus roseoflavus]
MWGVIGVPTTKAPISGATFGSYVLPPLVFYFVMAVLTITPRTRALRVACLVLVALLALRATVSVDMSLSCFNERKFHNDLAIPMLIIIARSLYWALGKEPLVRRPRPANSTPSTLVDALDLASNFRGYGWDWSCGVYIPRDTRPSSRTGFVLYVTVSAALHAFICGTFHRAIQSFSPVGLGSVSGGSIFDETVPLRVRYLRSSIISIIGCFATYSLLQTCYDLCTVLAILILRQDTTQWPPAFDAPWLATSLADFWGRRWHQWLRHIFLIVGYPLSSVFGRVGLVVGAFLSSSVFHHVGLLSLDTTSELWRMLIGFGMMAPVDPRGAGIQAVDGKQGMWAGRMGLDDDLASPVGKYDSLTVL